jgi:hypothetical protein
MLRHVTYISAIAVCIWLSAVGWYATFTPGEPQVFFLVWGLLFGLAAVILTFLWRIAST